MKVEHSKNRSMMMERMKMDHVCLMFSDNDDVKSRKQRQEIIFSLVLFSYFFGIFRD